MDPQLDKDNPKSMWPGLRATDGVFFLFAFIFVYSQVFQFPFTPIYFEGDHLVPVSNAMRMLGGEVIYRDFFHLAPPGTELIYESLFTAFGVRVWILNAMIVALGMGQIVLLWYFGRKTLLGYLAYLPGIIFLVIGFRQFGIDGSYRLFSVVLVLAAAAVLMGGRTASRLLIAGILCGLASFFVQTRGIVGVTGIAAFLLWEHYHDEFDLRSLVRQGAVLASSFVVTVVLTHSYFVWSAGADNYFFCIVKFLYAHYPNDPLAKTSSIFSDFPDINSYFREYSTAGALSRYIRFSAPVLFYYLLIPLIYVVYWLFNWKTQSVEKDRPQHRSLVLLSVVGGFLALGVSVPSAGRFNHVAIPGLVILVHLLSRISISRYFLPPILVGLGLIGAAYIVQRQIVEKSYVKMPAGTAAFLNGDIAERYRLISELTSPGDNFYEAHHPSFYFPMHLKNPTPMYLVRDSNYTPDFQVRSTVNSLAASKPVYLVWQGTWSKSAGERQPADNLQPLWDFVQSNYEFVVEYIDHGEYTLTSERRIQIWRLKQ